jgi:hypothetical protein
MITAYVGRQEPAHIITEIAIVEWPQGQVKMVGHQAIGEQTHGSSFAGLAEQLEKGIEVPILVEHGAAAVASIEDMVTVATLRSTSSTRHTLDYGQGPGESKTKSTMSPFILLCLPTYNP